MNSSFLFVVPTFNSYHLLPRLVLSLQQQTCTDWRLLFVDGPSSSLHRQWLNDCVSSEPRCLWVEQDPSQPGIFGAMNLGFDACFPTEYLCFWGSDDWAPNPHVLQNTLSVLDDLSLKGVVPDLLLCSGRYVNPAKSTLSRSTNFSSFQLFDRSAYRRALLFGCSPAHQASLIGPRARKYLSAYSLYYSLSADLDYFLKLSNLRGLLVQSIDLEFVHMSDDGVSSRHTGRRLKEVYNAYFNAFKFFWLIPMVARYLRRFFSLIR